MLDHLKKKVSATGDNFQQDRSVGLDTRLLKSFIVAGLNCPGFADWMRREIVEITGCDNTMYGVSRFAETWPFECLAKPSGVCDQEMDLWLGLIERGAEQILPKVPNAVWNPKYLQIGVSQQRGIISVVDEQYRDIFDALGLVQVV
jgi:hypothetical protein